METETIKTVVQRFNKVVRVTNRKHAEHWGINRLPVVLAQLKAQK